LRVIQSEDGKEFSAFAGVPGLTRRADVKLNARV
jgi:hypothetical protein